MKALLALAVVIGSLMLFASSPALVNAKATPTPKTHAASHKKKPQHHKAKPTPKATPKPKATPEPNSVTFKVWGNDGGNGTDITYSSDTTNNQTTSEVAGGSATAPAWTGSLAYGNNAEFYAVSAQMQGTGQLYCSVTVVYHGQTKTKQGSASGAYEICSAQLNNFLGWS